MVKNPTYEKLIVAACFLCNISQIPTLFNNRIIEMAYMGCWIVLALLLFFREKRLNLRIVILPIIFDLLAFTSLLFENSYFSFELFRPINLSAFILLIGFGLGRYIDIDALKKISFAFIVSSFIVAMYLYLNIFRGVDWASSGAYLYASKNSAGQIFLTATILTFLLHLKNHKIIWAGISLFFVSLIVMMKSRATLLTLVIVVLYYIFFIVKKTSYKILGIAIVALFTFTIMTNQELYNLYINQVMLNNRDINDISAITSNRDIQQEYFLQKFPEVWFFGTGNTYIESMPLTTLLSCGVLGGLPVLLFSLMPIYVGLKNIRVPKYRTFSVIVVLLGIMMWFNGLFEQQSPFGPGVKCYFLWLMTGILLGYKEEYELHGRDYGEKN